MCKVPIIFTDNLMLDKTDNFLLTMFKMEYTGDLIMNKIRKNDLAKRDLVSNELIKSTAQ